ncbi:hypothetical protein [Corynebacterium tapiri]|uniref:hypothetical protein n=1 Tax=Corynebacterium tapiri TaxID=1448266 RepID=UPI001FE3C2A5|nr:hypothetical protein [Corynebacterium tapiri]
MSSPIYRSEFSTGELISGLSWLGVGAIASLILEVVYLGTWLHVGQVALPFPWTIPVAFGFNMVLTRTARLWSERPVLAAVPLIVWCVGFFILLMWPAVTGNQLLGTNMRVVVLLMAGIAGGMWPLIRPQ